MLRYHSKVSSITNLAINALAGAALAWQNEDSTQGHSVLNHQNNSVYVAPPYIIQGTTVPCDTAFVPYVKSYHCLEAI